MKKLFIYYSFTGNGEVVSNMFKEHNYDLRKIEEKKKMPKSFFLSIMVGGFRAGLNLKGKLVNYNNDISDYDEIVVGSPIWNAKLPPAINKMLSVTDFNNKKVSFVLYSGSGEGKKAEKKINKLFGDTKITFLKDPKKNNEELKKLDYLFEQ